jgi:hypothetical protein
MERYFNGCSPGMIGYAPLQQDYQTPYNNAAASLLGIK